MYKGWARWEEQWRQAKKMRRSAEKVVSRWRHVLLAPAFLALKESAKELKGMRNAGAKVILRWQRLGLSDGFSGWSEHAATQRRMAFAAEKIMLRWLNMRLAQAYSLWNDHVKELLHTKRVLEKVALRMRNACMNRGWATWQEQWRQAKKMRRSAEKVVSRWRHVLVAPAFLALKESAKELKGMRNAGAKVILRWQRLGLSNGFSGWSEHAATQRRQASQMGKVLFRMHSMCVGRAMSTWDRATGRRGIMEKVLAKIRHRCVHPAWESWVNGSKELRRQRNMLDKLAMRMRSVLVYKAWATWRHNSNELRRQRCLLDKVALRMRSAGIHKACRSWESNVKELRHQRSVLEKMASRMRNVLVYSAWLAWEEFVKHESMPVSVGVCLDRIAEQDCFSSEVHVSFNHQLQYDICSALDIQVNRLTILCNSKGFAMNEIVFGKPDAHHLAQKFVCFVQNRDSKLAKTSMGKHIRAATMHGTINEKTLRALADANDAHRDELRSVQLSLFAVKNINQDLLRAENQAICNLYNNIVHRNMSIALKCWSMQALMQLRLRGIRDGIFRKLNTQRAHKSQRAEFNLWLRHVSENKHYAALALMLIQRRGKLAVVRSIQWWRKHTSTEESLRNKAMKLVYHSMQREQATQCSSKPNSPSSRSGVATSPPVQFTCISKPKVSFLNGGPHGFIYVKEGSKTEGCSGNNRLAGGIPTVHKTQVALSLCYDY
jgi:hypothetical protein